VPPGGWADAADVVARAVSAAEVPRGKVATAPLFVAIVALLAYALFTGLVLRTHSAADFAMVRRHAAHPAASIAAFGNKTHPSATIATYARPGTQSGPAGYDGQYAYFIALDPLHAAPSLDKPVYRYSHILYPLLARAVALGEPTRVPAALLLVNLAAIFVSTLALAILLRRAGRRPMLALLFAFFPGVAIAFNRDLNELVGFAFALSGAVVLDWRSRWRIASAIALFGLGALSRETVLLLPAGLALWNAYDRSLWRRSAALLVVPALPYLAWRAVLLAWLGRDGDAPPFLAPYPLAGAISGFNLCVVALVVPALLLGAAGYGRWARNGWSLALLMQILLFMVMLPAIVFSTYAGGYRIETGALVAAFFAIDRPRRRFVRAAAALAVGAPFVVMIVSLSAYGLRPL
jgi:hypothetical protein